MTALFVTSRTNDVDSLLRAWNCWHDTPCSQVTFPHMSWPNDKEIIAVADALSPEIIFYIGANKGSGIPSIQTLQTLRKIAPSVNLCCDGGDKPWHSTLEYYAREGCFDLQVTLDGHSGAPVDLVTITPVDPRPYSTTPPVRPIRCGFSGGLSVPRRLFRATGAGAPRTAAASRPKRPKTALEGWAKTQHPILNKLEARDQIVRGLNDGSVVMRQRTNKTSYAEHAEFLLSCRVILNTSFSGSGQTHHIKGRVLEAGWAGCALLETAGSPIGNWFPKGSYITYDGPADARRLIGALTDDEISDSAALLSAHVRDHYHPRKIYGKILEMLNVDYPKPGAAE